MSDLHAAADRVKNSFDAYVATMLASGGDPPTVISAGNDLHAAVADFARISVEVSGWGNPFALPADDDDDGPHEPGQPYPDVVLVEAQYKLRVTNPETLRQYVLDRAEKSGEVCEDPDIPVAQVLDLFLRDGWDPYQYKRPDLQVLDSRYHVSPVLDAIEED